MTLNERLAVWRGWKKAADGYWIEPYKPEPKSRVYNAPPPYDTDRNLIADELLERLTEEHWDGLGWSLTKMRASSRSFNKTRWLLTLPPADLAAAIAEVVCPEGSTHD